MKHSLFQWGSIVIGSIALIFIVAAQVTKELPEDNQSKMISEASAPEEVLTTEKEQQLQTQIAGIIKIGEISGCDEVKNEMYRKVCRNNITLKKAYDTGDVTYCQQLDGDLVPSVDCERQVVTTRSVNEDDITLCDLATDKEVKDKCRENYAIEMSVNKNDVAICDLSPTTTKCKDAFYLDQFFKAPESVNCSLFSTPEVQSDCTTLKAVPTDADDEELKLFCDAKQSDMFGRLCATLEIDKMKAQEGVQLPVIN